jgi:hypothetical protein
MTEPLTVEEILALVPGDRITVEGQSFDGSKWQKPCVVLQAPELHGYFYIGQQGTWALYARPEELESGKLAPSVKVLYRHRGERRGFVAQTSDVRFIYKGWQ